MTNIQETLKVDAQIVISIDPATNHLNPHNVQMTPDPKKFLWDGFSAYRDNRLALFSDMIQVWPQEREMVMGPSAAKLRGVYRFNNAS